MVSFGGKKLGFLNFGTKKHPKQSCLVTTNLDPADHADHAGRHRFDFIAQRVRADERAARAEREALARAVTR